MRGDFGELRHTFRAMWRKPLPSRLYVGTWCDDLGRRLRIRESIDPYSFDVSVSDAKGQPYTLRLLDDISRSTLNLSAALEAEDGKRLLQVEAGSYHLGLTYNLQLGVMRDGVLHAARLWDFWRELLLVPSVGVGLYDNWEDDLGVPWAFPLRVWRRCQ